MSNTPEDPASNVILRACVPACWAAAICGGVWSVASRTTEPPVYDAIGYIWKAKAIWERVAGHEVFNPFNVRPPIRPPGTVLLSYPFGFNDSVNGYLFRTVAVPYVLWTVAVWLAVSPWLRRSAAAAALFVAAIGTLPMFFQYAVGPGPFVAYWGLVDGFLGSLAGLAAAGLVRDWNRRSSPSFYTALAAACLGVWVKPAGVPLLFLWLGVWLGSWAGRALRQTTGLAGLNAELRRNRGRLVVSGAMTGLTIGCAFGTEYISQEYLRFGRNSFAVTTALFRDTWTVDQGAWFAAGTIGWLPLTAILILGAARSFTDRDRAVAARHPPWFAIGAWTAFFVGLCLAVPPMQIRYFFPFVLVWLALLLPRLAETFDSVQPARVAVSALLTAHLVVMGIVVLAPSPPRLLQYMAGVRTAPSAFVDDTALARSLSAAAAAMTPQRTRVAYIFQGHYGLALFESEIIYRAAVKPGRRLSDPVALTPRAPMDWNTGPVVKISDLRESDYLVLNRRIGPSWSAHAEASTFAEEQDVLQGYFAALGPADGVRPWGSTRLVAVLEVVDREAFTTKLETFVRSRKWRRFFLDANASLFAPSHELETPHTKPDHPKQHQSVSESPDVGRAVDTLVVPKWELDDSQIELCGSKQQIVVAERIEVTEVGAVLDQPFVVGSREHLRPAQRILDRLPQHVGEAERKTFVSDEVDEAHRFVVHRINEP